MLRHLFSKHPQLWQIIKALFTAFLVIASWCAVGIGLGLLVFGDSLPFFLSLMVPALIPLLWCNRKKLYAIAYCSALAVLLAANGIYYVPRLSMRFIPIQPSFMAVYLNVSPFVFTWRVSSVIPILK